jgi:hypothetical protein
MLLTPLDLKNPHGTATRRDLVNFMNIVANVLTGRPEDCFAMVSDLIHKLNETP